MLTGQPVFGGEDVTTTLARVLEREIDLNALPATVSPAVCHTIKLCLRKDPKKRIRHISDVRLALEGEFEALPAQATVGAVRATQSFWLKAVPLALVVGVAVWFLAQPPVEQGQVNRFVHATPVGQTLRNISRNVLAVSPDGRRFAYNTTQGLFLRELGELEARLIPGTEAGLLNPVFSPDGQSLAYWTTITMNLMRIAVSGGAPVVVAAGTAPVSGASWERDGSILFGSDHGIYRVAANGGTPELILETDDWAGAPELLPGGDHVLYSYGPNNDSRQIVMHSLSSDERTVLVQAGRDAHYLESGHLTYVYENNLLAVAFDPATGTVAGSPVPLVQGIAGATGSASSNYGFTDAGTLVYLRGQGAGAGSTLTWVNRAGQSEPLALPPREHAQVRLSPDGARLTTSLDGDLWVADVGRGVFSRITDTEEVELFPFWTPDGQQLIFSMANRGLGRIAADGTGAIESLVSFEDTTLVSPGDWTPDQSLVFTRQTAQGLRIGRIAPYAVDERPVPWEFALDREHGAAGSNLSPDGNWLTYHADDTGAFGVYIERYPELGNRRLVSDADGGWGAIWSPDGSELFYRRLGDGAMMVVPITTTPSLSVGTPQLLFESQGYLPIATPQPGAGSARPWDLGPDGRFLMLRSPNFSSPTNEFVIVENWIEELQRLVPVEGR
jgi:Tol biopolymer transport system component